MTIKITHQQIVDALEEMSSSELDRILSAAEVLYREQKEYEEQHRDRLARMAAIDFPYFRNNDV